MTAQKSFKIIVTFALAILPFLAFSQEEGSKIDEAAEKFNASGMIMHHIKDTYGWHFFGSGDNSFTLSLPVILFTDNGLVTFMSSAFNHDYKGKYVVEKDGMRFVNYNEKVLQLGSRRDCSSKE
jgi:F-type H+-transporting ATPase subunit a